MTILFIIDAPLWFNLIELIVIVISVNFRPVWLELIAKKNLTSEVERLINANKETQRLLAETTRNNDEYILKIKEEHKDYTENQTKQLLELNNKYKATLIKYRALIDKLSILKELDLKGEDIPSLFKKITTDTDK